MLDPIDRLNTEQVDPTLPERSMTTPRNGSPASNGHARIRQNARMTDSKRFAPPSRWRKTRNVALWVGVIGVAAAATGYTLMKPKAEDIPAAPRALPVRVTRAVPVTSYQVTRRYTGEVVAARTSSLGFELPEKLTAVYVKEGDHVAAATPLARLDTRHLETKLRALLARRAQAVAKLDEMVAGPRTEDIAAAKARIKSLEAQVALLKRSEARHRKAFARNAITAEEYDEVAFTLKTRDADRKAAQHNLEELLNGTRKEQVRAQRAVVAESAADIANVNIDLQKSTLKAPYAGTIARRLVDEGTIVAAGQAILRLVEDDALEAWIGLPVRTASELTVGSEQRLIASGRTYTARVSGLLPEVDSETRTRTVVLKLVGTSAKRLVHGQVVRLELNETLSTTGYWLPTTALTKGSRGLWSLNVAAETDSSRLGTGPFRVERRDVEVLHTESGRVLVRGTLRPGDRIITGGSHRIVPGQLVRVLKP